MVHRPNLCIIMDSGDVLIRRNFVHSERGAVTEKLTCCRQILPERHFHLAPAFCGDVVKFWCVFNNAALTERTEFRCALNRVLFELCRYNDVCYCRLGHKLISGYDPATLLP